MTASDSGKTPFLVFFRALKKIFAYYQLLMPINS